MSELFFLKIALPPVLVAAMSIATRVWGPTIGGLLLGLPWMTGPVLFALALDKGEAFAVEACVGIQLGVICIVAFMFAYAIASAIAGWSLSLAAAVAGFAAVAWATQEFGRALWASTNVLLSPLAATAGFAAVSLAIAAWLLPRPRGAPAPAALPWWDIPVRMLATLVLVAIIMLSADLLGPQLSGIVSTYPAILTVIGTFTHHQWGRDAVRRILRGLAQSLFAFVVFVLVVGTTLPALGLVGSYALASAFAVAISAGFLAFNRRRA
jgi:hypothetical protein